MSFSLSLRKVASGVIKKFGVECTFSHETEDSFDPATGIKSKTTTTFTAYGVKDGYSKEEVNGSTIQSSDIKLVVQVTGDIPVVDDTCTIGAITYRVMAVMDTDPADIDVIFEVQLRA